MKRETKPVKRFNNLKEALDYLKTKAKEGEAVILDERANSIHPRRISSFQKPNSKKLFTRKELQAFGEFVRKELLTNIDEIIENDLNKAYNNKLFIEGKGWNNVAGIILLRIKSKINKLK